MLKTKVTALRGEDLPTEEPAHGNEYGDSDVPRYHVGIVQLQMSVQLLISS